MVQGHGTRKKSRLNGMNQIQVAHDNHTSNLSLSLRNPMIELKIAKSEEMKTCLMTQRSVQRNLPVLIFSFLI